MNVSVLLEQVNDSAFRATTFAPVPLVAEGSTRQQAVEQIREMIREKLSRGEVIQVDVPEQKETNDPWMAMAGIWAGHPDAEDIEQNMREYRREVDADPSRL